MRSHLALILCSFLALQACAASTEAPDTADTSEDSADALTAADKTLIANAKTFFEGLLSDGDLQNKLIVSYEQLPSKVGKKLIANFPDRNAWGVAVAYRMTVKDGKGKDTVVFAVLDGISDEGEDFTLYTSKGRAIAGGDDYRGFRWNY